MKHLPEEISKNRALLMGIAILSIMLFHQSWIWGYNPVFAFFHFYGNWGVDMFFFLSGFGLYYSLKKDERVIPFYKRRFLRIIPICILCGCFRYVVDHVCPVGKGGYPLGIHEVSTDWTTILSMDKWFIPVILTYYLVMPWLYKFVNRYKKKLLFVSYFIVLLGEFTVLPNSYTCRFSTFCIGAIVASGLFERTKFLNIIGLGAILISLIYKFLIMIGYSSMQDSWTYIILSFGIVYLCYGACKTFSFSHLTKSISENYRNVSVCGLLSFLGRYSLELYLLHEFIYRYSYRFMINSSIPLVLQILISILITIIVALVFNYISNRFLILVGIVKSSS